MKIIFINILVLAIVVSFSQAYAEEITIKEWDIPTPDSAPHDVVVDKSGVVWFTEIGTNKIGKFDPNTEQFTEYPIPTPSSRPHGLVADDEGNIWFTEVGAGKIGKLDPSTGSIEEFETPTKNSGPHTPIISDDILWFTEQTASQIGKLDMNTGEIQEFPTITSSANPYGIITDHQGNAWFAELRGHNIGRVDAQTGQVTEYSPPTDQSGPRRIAIDSNGILWFTEYNSGKIASFDPNTEEMTEYDTSSENSGPYAIWVDLYDNVWFSMTGIYRVGKFDQSTQTLDEYNLPSPQTHIKFIHTDDKGNVWFPNYNNNKVGVIMPGVQVTMQDQMGTSADMTRDESIPDNIPSENMGIAYFPPPLKQIRNGVEPTHVTCTEGLELVLKMSNGNPACVKPTSVAKLIERGWAAHVLPDVDAEKMQNSEVLENGIYSVETDTVSYEDFSGFLARPTSGESFPGVILIHEWWGLNDNIKETAEKLASNGYVVLAVDLFDGGVATDAQTAMELTGTFDQDKAIVNMNYAVDYLESNYDVSTIGSIGWCFGGAQSLTLALNNDKMDATVIYYGRLITEPESLSSISWPILGIFGELDQGIPPAKVNEFEAALDDLGIENEIHIYPGADHAFANPTGERYAPEAADDAWQKTIEFLKENL